MGRDILAMLALILGVLAVVIVAMAYGARALERECIERGGWFTYIGGYPSCLPPGAK